MLKVLTYNIKSGRGSNGCFGSLKAVIQTIANTQAHIVGLQEVDYFHPRSGFTAQAQKISRLLNMHYAYGPNVRWFWWVQMGNAIISRCPITASQNFPLTSRGEPRGLLTTNIDFMGRPVLLATTHLGLDAKGRLGQVQEIKNLIRCQKHPLILTGDFNARPGSPEIKKLQARFGCADSSGTWPTFPARAPEHKIDYIFYSSHWKLVSYQVDHSLASDHLPCLATFNLKINAGHHRPG